MEQDKKSITIYRTAVSILGLSCFIYALSHLPPQILNWDFLLILVFSVTAAPRLSLKLPHSNFTVTFSDALVLLTMLFYGGSVAVVLATLEMLAACLYLKGKGRSFSRQTILCNLSLASIATGATALFWLFNPTINKLGFDTGHTRNLIIILGLLAFCQFFVTSLLFAAYQTLKTNVNLWTVWKKDCFSTSLSHITGAALAGIIYKLFYYGDWLVTTIAFLAAAIVYISYSLSIEEIINANAQAEQAGREKAEIERDRRVEAEKLNEQLTTSLKKEEETTAALRQSQAAFKHSALHDPLTNLANRQQFADILRKLISDYKENPAACFQVLFLDINRFKKVNDSFGHTVGDKVLMLIARRFLRNFRPEDTIARLGGDEFAIILHDLPSVTKALKVARKIQQAVAQPFALSGHRIFVSLNIGVAPCDAEYETPEEILRDADIAMHYAREKNTGVAVFTKELRDRFLERVKLETDLRFAVERGELLMHYQPLISLTDGSIIGFEALIRWQHKELGLIPPIKFIPIAENSGLIIPMTIWILQETCSQLANWQQMSPACRNLIMSVNISGKHLTNDELVDDIEEALDAYNLAPDTLKLEITESVAMENAEQTIEILRRLKQLGVQLSIDDFGTGYSSLNYLHLLPFDTLKIDRSFVYSVGESGENAEILQTIISLAKNLKMKVIAEGIETESQLSLLRNLGCDFGQGYLLAKPKSKEETEQLLFQNSHWFPTNLQNNFDSNHDSAVELNKVF